MKSQIAKKVKIKLDNTESLISGNSRVITTVRALVHRVANSSSTALITGESGTGKEVVAKEMHQRSARSQQKFVPVNCAAIPKDLLESELFGHRKGSFTGAFSDRVGRFQLADQGTVFLDEIGDMSSDMQVKLLRVLQERKIDPIGSQKEISIDVRVIAATHRDLQKEIELGKFREDLYYRLNVLPIHLPPLRDRLEDIPLLFNKFAVYHAKNQNPVGLSSEFCDFLKSYTWPGNIRELGNFVDRFSTLFPGEILTTKIVPASMLPKALADKHPNPSLSMENLVLGAHQPEQLEENHKRGFEEKWAVFFDQKWRLQQGNEKIPNNVVVKEFESEEKARAWINNQGGKKNPVLETIMLAQGEQEFPNDGLPLKKHLVDIEKNLIRLALQRAQGNISQTARLLNLQRTTLVEKINKYQLKSG